MSNEPNLWHLDPYCSKITLHKKQRRSVITGEDLSDEYYSTWEAAHAALLGRLHGDIAAAKHILAKREARLKRAQKMQAPPVATR